MTANTISPISLANTQTPEQNYEANTAKNVAALAAAKERVHDLHHEYVAIEQADATDSVMRAIAVDKNHAEDFVAAVTQYPYMPTHEQSTIVQWSHRHLDNIAQNIKDSYFLHEVVQAGEALRLFLMDDRKDNAVPFADVSVQFGLPVYMGGERKKGAYFTDLSIVWTPFGASHYFSDRDGRQKMHEHVTNVFRSYLAALLRCTAGIKVDFTNTGVIRWSFPMNDKNWHELQLLDSIAYICNKKHKDDFTAASRDVLRCLSESDHVTYDVAHAAAQAMTLKQFPKIMMLGDCPVHFGYGERATAAQFAYTSRAIFIDGSVDIENTPHDPACDCRYSSAKRFNIGHSHVSGGVDNFSINFDHHQGCIRSATSASCQQVLFALLSGLPSYFTNGGLPMLVINDVDADTALSCALIALVASRGVGALTPRIAQLVQTVGAIDTHGPSAVAILGGVPRFMQATSFPPNVTEQPIDQVVQKLQLAFDIISDDDKLAEAMKPNTFAPRVENESTCLAVNVHGEVIETKARNFAEAYQYGDFVVLGDEGARITVGKVGAFSPFRRTVRDFLDILNKLERKKLDEQGVTETSAHLWGGSDTIGGAPRTKAGSLLSMDEIKQALINFVGR